MQIKRLTKKDLPQFLYLFKKVLTEDFPEYKQRVGIIYRDHIFNEKFFKKFIKKRTNCILGAFEKNALIGSLVIYGHTHGGVAEFIWLTVDRTVRNKGVGTRLLVEGDRWVLNHKFHALFFHTESQKNIEFYKKRGYEYVGVERKAYFGIDEHLMRKILRDKPFEEIFKKYGL